MFKIILFHVYLYNHGKTGGPRPLFVPLMDALVYVGQSISEKSWSSTILEFKMSKKKSPSILIILAFF